MKNTIIEISQVKYVEFINNEIFIHFNNNLDEPKQIKLCSVFAFVFKGDIYSAKYINIRSDTSYCLDIKGRICLDDDLPLFEMLLLGASSEDVIPFRVVASSYELYE